MNRRASTPVIRDNSIFTIRSFRPGAWSSTHIVRHYRRRFTGGRLYTGEVTQATFTFPKSPTTWEA